MRVVMRIVLLMFGTVGGVLIWRNREMVQQRLQGMFGGPADLEATWSGTSAGQATGYMQDAYPLEEMMQAEDSTPAASTSDVRAALDPMATLDPTVHSDDITDSDLMAAFDPAAFDDNMDTQREAQSGHHAVARDKIDRTLLEAADLGPQHDSPEPAQLEAYGDDMTITDRVQTRLGRYMQAEGLAHLNINTQEDGVVYLRGPVHSAEQRDQIEQIARETEGVREVVNELDIQHEIGGVG